MTDSIPAPVAALLDAANAHDTAAFLAAFSADGVVDDWGREFTGAGAIRGWSDAEFIGVRVTLESPASSTRATRRSSPLRSGATASTARATSRSTSPATGSPG